MTAEVGLNAKRGPGLGILTGDFGSDGYPGFMVANDGAANHLWISSTAQGSVETERPRIPRRGPHARTRLRFGRPGPGRHGHRGRRHLRRWRGSRDRHQPSHRVIHLVPAAAERRLRRRHRAVRNIPYFPALQRLWRRLVGYGESRPAGYVQRQWRGQVPWSRSRASSFLTANATCCCATGERQGIRGRHGFSRPRAPACGGQPGGGFRRCEQRRRRWIFWSPTTTVPRACC